MSIWTEGQKRFMFEAYTGREFAKWFEKERVQRTLRANQLKNQKRAKQIERGSTKESRRIANVVREAAACYAVYHANQKPFNPSPIVSPPK